MTTYRIFHEQDLETIYTDVVADKVAIDGINLVAIKDGEQIAGFRSWRHYERLGVNEQVGEKLGKLLGSSFGAGFARLPESDKAALSDAMFDALKRFEESKVIYVTDVRFGNGSRTGRGGQTFARRDEDGV